MRAIAAVTSCNPLSTPVEKIACTASLSRLGWSAPCVGHSAETVLQQIDPKLAPFGIQRRENYLLEVAQFPGEVGPGVRDVKVGEHVVGSLIQSCGHCLHCVEGRSFQCDSPEETLRPASEGQRLTRQGQPVTTDWETAGFAEFALIHENQLVTISKDVPFPQASLLGCSVITGAGSVINTARLRPGETVAIIGVSGVGLNAISGARIAGASQIIAIDMDGKKEELARKFGATHFVNASTTDTVAAVLEISVRGVDHAFEAIGLVSTSQQATKMVTEGGTAYFIGVHKPGTEMALSGLELVVGQTGIRGVFMGSSNIKHDVPMFADLYIQGRFNLDDLVARTISISEIDEAYELLKHGAVARSVITSF